MEFGFRKQSVLAEVKNSLESEYAKWEKKNVDWVTRRGSWLTCLQDFLIIDWVEDIFTGFLGSKKAYCWEGARMSIHSIS